MLHSLRTPALCLLLATSSALLPITPAHAGEMNSSEATVVISAVLVLSMPVAASVGLAQMSAEPFKASAKASEARREKARQLPPMEVKEVKTAPDGACTVQLQVADDPQQTATLHWPARADSPGHAFVAGQQVSFVPTANGAGWNIHDAQGTTLAYAPTAFAAGDNSSGLW